MDYMNMFLLIALGLIGGGVGTGLLIIYYIDNIYVERHIKKTKEKPYDSHTNDLYW